MRYTTAEKIEIIRLVEQSEIGVNRTLRELGIHKRTFYNWYHRYRITNGFSFPLIKKKTTRRVWDQIPQEQRNLIVELALDYPTLSSRELAVKLSDEQGIFVSESSVYVPPFEAKRLAYTSFTHCDAGIG